MITLYTIGTQETFDDRLATDGPFVVAPGKFAFLTVADAVAYLRALTEPWHLWCAVYKMTVKRTTMAVAVSKRGTNPADPVRLRVKARVTRRVWPLRNLTILKGAVP